RLEFKAFDMPVDRADFLPCFLLWLWLVADSDAPGYASDQDRVYDLGAVARFGWAAEGIAARAEEVLDRATNFLASRDWDPAPLGGFRQRLDRRWNPAVRLIAQIDSNPSMSALMRFLDRLAEGDETRVDTIRSCRVTPLLSNEYISCE